MNPKHFKPPFITDIDTINGFKLLTLKKVNSSNKHFYFMHGGAYTMEPVKGHRRLMKDLVNMGYKVTYIDYPLYPEYNSEKTNEITIAGFKKIVLKYSDDEFYFIGDSSGGGLAVSILMQLRDSAFPKMPHRSILFSPWLDVSEQNPKLPEYEKIDITLTIKSLKTIGEKYAEKIGVNHPMISPIYGNMNDLGAILLFFSRTEIMYPDCSKFVERLLKAKGTTIETNIENKAPHDFIIQPTRDQHKRTLRKIVEFIEK